MMTETENLDLRQEMCEIIDHFYQAKEYVRDGDFVSAQILWQKGKELTLKMNIKLNKLARD